MKDFIKYLGIWKQEQGNDQVVCQGYVACCDSTETLLLSCYQRCIPFPKQKLTSFCSALQLRVGYPKDNYPDYT